MVVGQLANLGHVAIGRGGPSVPAAPVGGGAGAGVRHVVEASFHPNRSRVAPADVNADHVVELPGE